MPDPHDSLAIFAEVSVALAGFSGIAMALGRRSLGALTPLDQRRLQNLFALSGGVLCVSLLGIALLHVQRLELNALSAAGSGLISFLAAPWLILDWQRVRRLSDAERADVRPWIFIPFTLAAVFVTLLQLFNLFVLHAAWPVFVALLTATVLAFQQFVLLVQSGFGASA